MMMKYLLFILLSLVIFTASCSSKSSPSNSSNIVEPITKNKLLAKIKLSTINFPDTLVYSNGKLFKIYFKSSNGLYQFKYTNGKVSKMYSNFFGPTYINLESDISDNVDYFDFQYDSNNKLKKVIYFDAYGQREVYKWNFEYNSLGKINISSYYHFGSKRKKYVIEYTGENIKHIEAYYTYTDSWIENITFEYDDKINPIYILSQKYGLNTVETLNDPIDYQNLKFGVISKNNVLKVYSDGVLIFSSTYQYDSDGYPISSSWNDFVGNYSGDVTYEYIDE